MTDEGETVTLADLVEATESAGDGGDGDGGGSAEWIDTLVGRLDERGYLDPLIEQQLGIEPDAEPDGGEVPADGGGADAPSADALGPEDIARFGRRIIDEAGDIQISQVVMYAENNPQVVERLIREEMGGESATD